MSDSDGFPGSLIDRMRNGDEGAFSTLVMQRSLRMRVIIRQLAGSAARADCDEEDLFQLVIFRAWQLRDAFVDQGPGSFHRWMVALARNIVGDRLRYLNAKGRNGGARFVSAASIASAIPDSITSITSRSARNEDAKRLEEVLIQLDPSTRELIQLYYLEGLYLSQVAKRSNRPRSSIWEDLKKALGLLRAALPGVGL